jgi:hypothetical protein
VLAIVYRNTHKGVSYSQSFAHTMVIFGVCVAFIMLIVGTNIARAFTMVGALSVVRFRNAMKEPRDLGFVFMAMAVGMACGTRFYVLATFATVFLSAAVILLSKLSLFAKVIRERILIVRLPMGQKEDETFEEVFSNFLAEQRLISMETVREGQLSELIYSVVLKRRTDPAQFLAEVRKVNGSNKVSLVLGQQDIDL